MNRVLFLAVAVLLVAARAGAGPQHDPADRLTRLEVRVAQLEGHAGRGAPVPVEEVATAPSAKRPPAGLSAADAADAEYLWSLWMVAWGEANPMAAPWVSLEQVLRSGGRSRLAAQDVRDAQALPIRIALLECRAARERYEAFLASVVPR